MNERYEGLFEDHGCTEEEVREVNHESRYELIKEICERLAQNR